MSSPFLPFLGFSKFLFSPIIGAPVLLVLAEFFHMQVLCMGGPVRAEAGPQPPRPACHGEGEQETAGHCQEEEERGG